MTTNNQEQQSRKYRNFTLSSGKITDKFSFLLLDFSPREDAAPIPPPRSHKRSGQSEEEELEGQSEEVVVEEKTSFRGGFL